MRKKLLIYLLFQFLCIQAFSQLHAGQLEFSRVPVPKMHYQQEYTSDTIVNPSAWLKQKAGMHVSFATTNQLYFRREVPELKNENLLWEKTGWKGERLNTQVLIWSTDTLTQVRFKLNDLVNSKGNVIPKNNLNLNMVRYVISNYPYAAKDVTCGASPYKDLYLMPDRFEPFDRFDVPGKTLRPVWLSLDVPQGTAPGKYKGTIEVQSAKQKISLRVEINVQDQAVPPPHEWQHRLDIWQNPWAVARYNNLIPWSPEHKALLKQHLKLYADAGGKFITTYAVHSPWSDNSYMTEDGMIDWLKLKDGSWKFDYSIFDQYVELAMEMGIDKAITIYSPVPWGSRFRYMDEKTGNFVYETWPPDSQKFKEIWTIFLTDLKQHLEKKGWFDKTYIGINENVLNQTLAAVNMVKGHSKSWKITYAGDWHPELKNLLDDYCFLYGKESDLQQVKDRAASGFTTTYYVCCNPPYPNNFVFSPPAEGRWISWYTAAHSYDGFLRWAYDAWPQDPMRDARHELWPAGDCYMVYPGGNSGIRYEKLREGIVDFEKIRILKAKAGQSNDKKVRDLIKQLDLHLQIFLAEKDFDPLKITKDVTKGEEIIEALSNALKP